MCLHPLFSKSLSEPIVGGAHKTVVGRDRIDSCGKVDEAGVSAVAGYTLAVAPSSSFSLTGPLRQLRGMSVGMGLTVYSSAPDS